MKECIKKKKHISEEQHYLCEIGLEKMLYGSSWLYKSYTEESLTHITITAYYNVGEAFLQASTASWGNLWDCRAALRKLVSSVYLESDLNLPFGKKRKILIPTWVYSCCVRHEENRSENCRIVFPPMGVSRMGYGYCNIIYGQIRQKSLIFFCLSVIPFVTRPPPLLSSPMVETPALKETFQKTQRGDHF